MWADQRDIAQLVELEKARLHPVIHVVIIVGDIVGQGGDLGFC